MARSFDIETLIEDAFIGLLPDVLSSGVTVVRWEDVKEKSLTPMVKLRATVTEEEPGTVNYYVASRVTVDFAVFTTKKDDEDGKTANSIRGEIRELLCADDVVAQLNAESDGLSVYSNGVIPQDAVNVEDDKLWQKNTSALVVATTVEPA